MERETKTKINYEKETTAMACKEIERKQDGKTPKQIINFSLREVLSQNNA